MITLRSIHNNPGGTRYAAATRLLVLIALLIVVSGCATQQSTGSDGKSADQKAAESNTSLGLEYMNRGQFEVALGKLKKAVKADPNYAPAHTVMAVLYERIGEKELAGKHYQKAFEAAPADGDVNNNYGVYLCKVGESSRAMKHFLKALEDPFYSSPSVALTNAGSCELGRGDLEKANEYLRKALKIESDFPDALITMARLNFEKPDYLTARAFLQRYEAVASHGAASLLLAFKIETAAKDHKSALKYKRALEANFPDSNQTAEVRRITGK